MVGIPVIARVGFIFWHLQNKHLPLKRYDITSKRASFIYPYTVPHDYISNVITFLLRSICRLSIGNTFLYGSWIPSGAASRKLYVVNCSARAYGYMRGIPSHSSYNPSFPSSKIQKTEFFDQNMTLTTSYWPISKILGNGIFPSSLSTTNDATPKGVIATDWFLIDIPKKRQWNFSSKRSIKGIKKCNQGVGRILLLNFYMCL